MRIAYSLVPFLVDDKPFKHLPPESRLVLSKLLRQYEDEFLYIGTKADLARALGVSLKVTIRALLYLEEERYVVIKAIKVEPGPSLRRFEFLAAQSLIDLMKTLNRDQLEVCGQAFRKYRSLLEEVLGNNRNDGGEVESSMVSEISPLGIDEIAERSRNRRKHKLSVGGRVLLATLLLHYNPCGVVRGVSRSSLSATTGLTKDRLINLTQKLVTDGYLLKTFPGATIPEFFGRVSTVYCINPDHLLNAQAEILYRTDDFEPHAYRWMSMLFGEPMTIERHRRLVESFTEKVRDWPAEEDLKSKEEPQLEGPMREAASQVIQKLIKVTYGRGVSGHLQIKLAAYVGMFLSTYQQNLLSLTDVDTSILSQIREDLNPGRVQCPSNERFKSSQNVEKDHTLDEYEMASKVIYAVAFHQAKTVSLRLSQRNWVPKRGGWKIELVPLESGKIMLIFAAGAHDWRPKSQ